MVILRITTIRCWWIISELDFDSFWRKNIRLSSRQSKPISLWTKKTFGAMGSDVKPWESWKFKLYFHNFFNPVLSSDRNNIDSDYITLDRYKQRAIYFCNYLDCEECTLGWRTCGQASTDILDFFTFGKRTLSRCYWQFFSKSTLN